MAFDGDVMCELAAQFLALAEKQEQTGPLMIGHRLMGTVADVTGEIAEGRAHLRSRDRALRSCRASSAGDAFWPRRRCGNLVLSVVGLWLLGYPEAALADAEHALKDAREIGHAATLMYACYTHRSPISCLRKLRGSKRASR